MSNCIIMCKVKTCAVIKQILHGIFNQKQCKTDCGSEPVLIEKVVIDNYLPPDDEEFIIDETDDEFDPGIRRLIELSESETSEYLKAIREHEEEEYE